MTLLVFVGCVKPAPDHPVGDAGPVDIDLRGRVVDYESCASWDRCGGVEGVLVRLRTLPHHVSEPTGGPGRFSVTSPQNHEDDLLVDPSGEPGYAPTLNPWTAPAAISNVYGIELYVLASGHDEEGRPSLTTALLEDHSIDLIEDGGYVGQVLRRDSSGLHAVQGARVELILPTDWPPSAPTPVVRFVQNLPRFTDGPVLYSSGIQATGPFGTFVIAAGGQHGVITVRVQTSDTVFTEMVATVQPQAVTLGFHTP